MRVAEFGEDSYRAKEVKEKFDDPKTVKLAGTGPRQTFVARCLVELRSMMMSPYWSTTTSFPASSQPLFSSVLPSSSSFQLIHNSVMGHF